MSSKRKFATSHRATDDKGMEIVGDPIRQMCFRSYQTMTSTICRGKRREFECTESPVTTEVCNICKHKDVRADLDPENQKVKLWAGASHAEGG